MSVSIEAEKKELRRTFRRLRKDMPAAEKAASDAAIAQQLLQSTPYREARLLLAYHSLPQEIDTDCIIRSAWEQGKTVAVPLCDPQTHGMVFYRIASPDDLHVGSYGIAEPDPRRCLPVTPDERSLCLVPAFTFDERGFRLGYGGGYYDRFLAEFSGMSMGLCRQTWFQPRLPAGAFDRNVHMIVMENRIFVPGKDTL